MSIPAGYFYKDGFYWTTGGAGPLAWDGTNFYLVGTTGASGSERDMAAGTWASRPTTGFVNGVKYYRRMTDLGDTNKGGLTMVRTVDMTEWGFESMTPWLNETTLEASPLHTLTIALGVARVTLATFPPDFLAAIKKMAISGVWKNSLGGSSVTASLLLGINASSSDNQIRQQATVAAGNSWNIKSDVWILSATTFARQSGNYNVATTANYDEFSTSLNTAAENYLSLDLSAGTNGNTSKVLSLQIEVM